MFTQRCVISRDMIATIDYLGQDKETTKLILWDGTCVMIWRSGSRLRELDNEFKTLVVDGGLKWNVYNDLWTLQFTGELTEVKES